MQDQKRIWCERRSDVVWLTINRADKANAMTLAMMVELTEHIVTSVLDSSIRALVLTGAGRRAFCGGVDVHESTGLTAEQATVARSRHFFALLHAAAAFTKPVIVGVNGAAAGGGAMLALLGDRLVASANASLAIPEIDLGSPSFAAIAVLAQIGGSALAGDLVQTGRRMSAADALARGLYAEIAKAEELSTRLESAAQALGSKPAQAFALNKQWMRRPLIDALRRAEDDTRTLRASGAIC